MEISESYETGYKCIIWYDYTRELFNKIKEGSFLAVKNFQMPKDNRNEYYSILKIVKKMPTHYASIERLAKGYPAFSEESIKGVRDSFTDQVTESFEDLTKIVVNVVPTFFQVCIGDDSDSLNKISIEADESIPILGEVAKILHNDVIEKIINGSLSLEQKNVIELAHFKNNDEISVFLDIESCLKTHFGIFGFTGVGKTNLVSTFISKIFKKKETKKKVLFFDIMEEYLGLLIDLFFEDNLNSKLVYLDVNDLSYEMKQFFEGGNISKKLVLDFYNQMILPKVLQRQNYKNAFLHYIEEILKNKSIRVLGEKLRIIDWLNDTLDSFLEKRRIGDKHIFKRDVINFFKFMVGKIYNINANEMTSQIKDILYANLKERIEHGDLVKKKVPKQKKSEIDLKQKTLSLSNNNEKKEIKKDFIFNQNFKKEAWIRDLNLFVDYLFRRTVTEFSKIKDFLIDKKEILSEVQSNDTNSLYIFVSNKEQNVRSFLNEIGQEIYDYRKNLGVSDPITSLIFDEADTFIPQKSDDPTVIASKEMIEQIARRGRKFGLGIGLATQRITFLETNILAQLHTYFISRLPRKSDRDRIKEAFSLSDEEFEATLKFVKGNWLLVSHEGLGLEGVPLSIKAEDANERIKKFLRPKKK